MQMLEVQGQWTSSQLINFHQNSTYEPKFTLFAFRSTFYKREKLFPFHIYLRTRGYERLLFISELYFEWTEAKNGTLLE